PMGDQGLVRELTAAIETALGDPGRWPDVYALLEAAGAPAPTPASRLTARLAERHGLTRAEAEVLQRLIAGDTPRDIAIGQGVALATVRTHIAHLREKFGVSRTIELLRRVLMEGLRAD